MKLSFRIDAPEDSSGAEDGSNKPDYTDVRYYAVDKVAEVLEKYLTEILPDAEDYEFSEISLTFMTAEEIRAVNFEYRQVDEPTDVLSFPLIMDKDMTLNIPGFSVLLLGDIVICPEEVARLHPELSLKQGIALMIAHAFLHLLGYDHDTQEKQELMWDKQDIIARNILEVLG